MDLISKKVYAMIGRKRRMLAKWCKDNNLSLLSVKADGILVYDNEIKDEKFISFESIEF